MTSARGAAFASLASSGRSNEVTVMRLLVASGLAACTLLAAGNANATDPDRVEWSKDWPRVRLWEGIGAVVLTVADAEIEPNVPIQSQAHWRGGVLFDDWARSTLRGRTAALQSAASTASDILYYGGTIGPLVIDNYFVTLSIHQNADVALQMFVINMQSLGVSGLVSLVAEHGVGRARPYTDKCDAQGHIYDASGALMTNHCGTTNDYRSFFSGHTAAVSTMAGLTCAHHQHLPLYGGGLADLAACLVMIGAATATGILRIVYDEHWASDVMTGAIVGAASGYVLPSLLHYGFGRGRGIGEIGNGSLWMAPSIVGYPGGAGLGAMGLF
jgi:membrane-associated phospholipid phosphatase